jgi:catechol 2,3-dioxygenase-like lactoylglutathione lyase family enzyme
MSVRRNPRPRAAARLTRPARRAALVAWLTLAASACAPAGARPSPPATEPGTLDSGALGASALVERAAPAAAPSEPALGLPAVRGLGLTVSDLDASVALFRAFDFQPVDERFLAGPAFEALVGIEDAEQRVAVLRLGSERIELAQYVQPLGRPIPRSSRSNDAIFQHMAIVVRDIDAAFEHVRRQPGVRLVSPAPQTIPASNPAAGGIRAVYFEDADGHDLELIWFPTGKGRARWQQAQRALFLGIDHSALAVSNSDDSERSYRALGFDVGGRSTNFGREQAALSGVPGARVQITGMLGGTGLGVEFLQYLEPGPGAPAPADAAPNDLFHWEIQLEVASLEAALAALRDAGGSARAPVDIRSLDLGYRRAALARDRDGHALRLLER